MTLRKDSSLTHNENFLDVLTKSYSNTGNTKVFGNKGRGVYQDSVLNDIEARITERTERLEKIIKDRQSTEKTVTTTLTLLAILSIILVYVKLQKCMGAKPNFGAAAYGGS